MKKFLLIPIFLSLIGCTSIHLTPDKAIVVPPVAYPEPTKERPIKVILMRDYGAYSGAGGTYHIFDNGERVGQLESREMTTYYAGEGQHSITVGWSIIANNAPKASEANATSGHFSTFKIGEEPEFHFGVTQNLPYLIREK